MHMLRVCVQGLFSQLRPYMQQADDVGMPLCFAGHSLGEHQDVCVWGGGARC